MDIEDLKCEALKLTPTDRARLARELLDSVEVLPPQELPNLWRDEAGHRAAQIDAGEVTLVSTEEVDRKASRLLRIL